MDAGILGRILQLFSNVPEADNRAKIGPKAFLVALITALLNDTGIRTIAGLRRTTIGSLGETLARSTFWQRLASKRLTNILLDVIRELIKGLSDDLLINAGILEKLGLKNVFLLDSTTISLPSTAKKDFPAPRNNVNPAGIKWHLCLNLFSGLADWFCLTEATTHDRLGFPPLKKLKDALIIFDLGYWDYNLFSELAASGAYFLSRVKERARIEITGLTTPINWPGILTKNLFDINSKTFRGNIIELIGTIFHGESESTDMRVIGFWNETHQKYHWYVSNLRTPAALIYPLYRLRWQVELTFKATKSSLSLDDVTSSDPNIIFNLVLATITSFLISQPLARSCLTNATQSVQSAFSIQRGCKFLVQISNELMDYLLSATKESLEALQEKMLLFITELIDPNYKNRATSLRRIQVM